jgi:hypothetical protein
MAGLLVALGVLYVVISRPEPEPRVAPRPPIWSVEMDELETVAIDLPSAGKSEAWVRRADRDWYFDRPNGPKVDARRWGGGIPLLLSGPRAERLIAAGATADQLRIYGFDTPRMTVDLVLENGTVIAVEIGEPTPDGSAYYVRLAGSTDVYSVHRTWFAELDRLVLDPPYPGPGDG